MSGLHTPGPWTLGRREKSCIGIDAKYGDVPWGKLAKVVVIVDGEPCSEGEANARLISAAPELSFWLSQLLDAIPAKRDWLDPVIEANARAAIAKATGADHD